MEADADNYNPDATISNDNCLYEGCTYEGACNYDETANSDNGSCEYSTCAGCTTEGACNFDAEATIQSGNCTYPEPGYDCDGNCMTDTDGDSICDEFEIAGCTDSEADNYTSEATDDDGSVNTSLKDVQIHKLVTRIHLQTQMTLAVNLNLLGGFKPSACNYEAEAITS